ALITKATVGRLSVPSSILYFVLGFVAALVLFHAANPKISHQNSASGNSTLKQRIFNWMPYASNDATMTSGEHN
ncbi:hypothetical protein AAVH_11983, partial [Aphelenchoides avenae]